MAWRSASISSSYRYTSENRPDPGGSKTMSMSYRLRCQCCSSYNRGLKWIHQVICWSASFSTTRKRLPRRDAHILVTPEVVEKPQFSETSLRQDLVAVRRRHECSQSRRVRYRGWRGNEAYLLGEDVGDLLNGTRLARLPIPSGRDTSASRRGQLITLAASPAEGMDKLTRMHLVQAP